MLMLRVIGDGPCSTESRVRGLADGDSCASGCWEDEYDRRRENEEGEADEEGEDEDEARRLSCAYWLYSEVMSVSGVRSAFVGGRPFCSRKDDSQRRSCRFTADSSSRHNVSVVIRRGQGKEGG